MSSAPLLAIDSLAIAADTTAGPVTLVSDLSIEVDAGEIVALCGESGSGKTVGMLTAVGLGPAGCRVTDGTTSIEGTDLGTMARAERARFLSRHVGVVFQEPMAALNPLMRVGQQVAEAAILRGHPRADARKLSVELLGRVGLRDPESVARAWPHTLSGGMRQRVMIATALAGGPRLIVADEPTTALDVTIQAQIMDLLAGLADEQGIGVVLITHDLSVVATWCSKVWVLYAGEVVESGPIADVGTTPLHPYTHGLLASTPRFAAGGGHPVPVRALPGAVPRPGRWLAECRFAARCSRVEPDCTATSIPFRQRADERACRCLHPFGEAP